MPHLSPPSAKERVLAWVRSKNPSTMELKFGCNVKVIHGKWEDMMFTVCAVYHSEDGTKYEVTNCTGTRFNVRDIKILGSDMGLSELLIALKDVPLNLGMYTTGRLRISNNSCIYGSGNETCVFDLTKNVHKQPDEFYEAILPLLP